MAAPRTTSSASRPKAGGQLQAERAFGREARGQEGLYRVLRMG
jgi:hypothetical protein